MANHEYVLCAGSLSQAIWLWSDGVWLTGGSSNLYMVTSDSTDSVCLLDFGGLDDSDDEEEETNGSDDDLEDGIDLRCFVHSYSLSHRLSMSVNLHVRASLCPGVSELRAVSFSASEDLSDVYLMQFILYTAIGKQGDPCG